MRLLQFAKSIEMGHGGNAYLAWAAASQSPVIGRISAAVSALTLSGRSKPRYDGSILGELR